MRRMLYDPKSTFFSSPLLTPYAERLFFRILGKDEITHNLDWQQRGTPAFARQLIDQLSGTVDDFPKEQLWAPVQPDIDHGNHTAKVDATQADQAIPATDGIYTNTRLLPLMTPGADCSNLLFYDPTHHAIGLAHAGWRGIIGDIAGQMLAGMQKDFGTRPIDVRVIIGPTIGACGKDCYEVNDDVASLFAEKYPSSVIGQPGSKTHLNLAAAVQENLTRHAIPTDHIDADTFCTRCHPDLLYSRRGQPGSPENQLAVAVLL